MHELRRDALSGRSVLLSTGRAARPHTFPRPDAGAGPSTSCPFCPGNEHETPPEVARTGDGAPDTPGWRVRVAPNLYPIVGGPGAQPGTTGAHEVAVLSPSHDRSLSQLDDAEAVEVFGMLRDRVRHHLEAGRAHAFALVNHGRAAGASIAHPHAQVAALDSVPPAVRAALERWTAAGHDLVAADRDEAEDRGLTVAGGDAPAWCPYAAPVAYATRIAHADAGARFGEAPDDLVSVLACATRDVLARLAAATGDAPYNLVVHTAPAGNAARFRWYLEITPRLGVAAGFELGTGFDVNVLDPAEAAARLRGATPTTRRR